MIPDQSLSAFLQEIILSDEQLQELYRCFTTDVSRGLQISTRSEADIKCYPTYVHSLPDGEERGKYLALDLGGTNFRVLLVTLRGHHEVQIDSETFAVSQQIMTGTGEQLFDHIADCLAAFVLKRGLSEEHLPLGFTFSFPCEQLGLKKALLVRWTKGFKCSGVVREDVGRLLAEAVVRRGGEKIDVIAVLNDTTGTLMSCAHRNPECRVGVIIGTGCNACYVEKSENVQVLEEDLKRQHSHVVINTEWGAFGDKGCLEFIRTDYDRQIDADTLNRGTQLFEKMISGMYLGQLVRLVLLKAMQTDLIFSRCPNKAHYAQILAENKDCIETRHLSEIEDDTGKEFSNARKFLHALFGLQEASLEDCQKLHLICATISRRAANLVAVALSGLINRISERKVVVGVDGSVYRFHPKFDAYMRETMRKFVKPNIDFDLMLSHDGSGRGAALVAAVASQKP